MNHQLIEINKLEKSPQNARRTVAKGAAEDLKASIIAHGILHNLVVTEGDGGMYRVTAITAGKPKAKKNARKAA